MKKIFKLLFAGIMLCLVTAMPCNAQSQKEITDKMRCSLYLSEKSEDSTASSFVMLFNRIKILKGETPPFDTDISSIQKVLYDSKSNINSDFTYDKLKVKLQNTHSLKELLAKHPEGVVITNKKDAVLVTVYDEITEEFMCMDPAYTSPLGEIPLSQSKIKSADKAQKCYAYTGTKLSGEVVFDMPETEESATIIYHDGDTAIFDVQTEIVLKAFYLSQNTPQKEGMRFLGWSDSAISDKVSYVAGDIYTLSGDINLYAVYEKEETQHKKQTYTVNYYSDEALIHTQTVEGKGFTKAVPTVDMPQKDGYTFLGWRGNFYGENLLYPACEPFNLCSDTDFYAVWQKNGTYSITYSAIHAKNVPYRQSSASNTACISPVTPYKDGYIFKGWSTADGKILKPSQEIELNGNIMLYALFEKGNATIELKTQKADYNANEPVVLSFEKISATDAKYEITVVNLKSNLKTLYEADTGFEHILPQGQYCAYVTASYSHGTYVSNKVNFAVWEETQSNLIEVFADGKKIIFDTQPVIQDGVTLVPLRAIMETFDAQLFWNGETGTVTAVCGINVLKFTVNKGVYYKNGEQKTVSAPPQIINGRTLVPLRALAEGFDYLVHWQADTSNIYIYSQSYDTLSENAYYITDQKHNLDDNCDIWVIKCVNESFGLYEIRSFYDGTYLAPEDKCVSEGTAVKSIHGGAHLSALWIFEKQDDGYYIKNAQDEGLYLSNHQGTPVLSTNEYLFEILPLMQF